MTSTTVTGPIGITGNFDSLHVPYTAYQNDTQIYAPSPKQKLENLCVELHTSSWKEDDKSWNEAIDAVCEYIKKNLL